MGKNLKPVGKVIYFCAGSPCAQKGAENLIRETRALLKTEGQYRITHTVKTQCAGQCEQGPILAVQPDNIWYRNMDLEKSERVVREHIMAGIPVDDFILHSQGEGGQEEFSSPPQRRSIPFEIREVDGWGEVRVATMHPWEKILYPLFKDLFVNRFRGLEFRVPGKESAGFKLDRPAALAYDGSTAVVECEAGSFSFVIGLFKERDPDHTRLWRARITEVIFIETVGDLGHPPGRLLVATSRSGEQVLEVRFPASEVAYGSDPWEHFTSIYLERP